MLFNLAKILMFHAMYYNAFMSKFIMLHVMIYDPCIMLKIVSIGVVMQYTKIRNDLRKIILPRFFYVR